MGASAPGDGNLTGLHGCFVVAGPPSWLFVLGLCSDSLANHNPKNRDLPAIFRMMAYQIEQVRRRHRQSWTECMRLGIGRYVSACWSRRGSADLHTLAHLVERPGATCTDVITCTNLHAFQPCSILMQVSGTQPRRVALCSRLIWHSWSHVELLTAELLRLVVDCSCVLTVGVMGCNAQALETMPDSVSGFTIIWDTRHTTMKNTDSEFLR